MSAKDSDKGAANSEPTGLSEEELEGARGGSSSGQNTCWRCGRIHPPPTSWSCP